MKYATAPEIRAEMKVILEDTISFYSEDVTRRAFDSVGNCAYQTDDGKSCAIGRHCSPRDLQFLKDTKQNVGCSVSTAFDFLEIPKIKHFPVDFLQDLQRLHDNNHNWNTHNGEGISYIGSDFVKKIKNKYGLN